MALTDAQITRVVLQRMVLGIGIIFGFFPLLAIPILALGGTDSWLAESAPMLNGITLLPACVLGYWKRRIAALWLAFDAAVILFALVLRVPSRRWESISDLVVYSLIPISVAIIVVTAEVRSWPPILGRS